MMKGLGTNRGKKKRFQNVCSHATLHRLFVGQVVDLFGLGGEFEY